MERRIIKLQDIIKSKEKRMFHIESLINNKHCQKIISTNITKKPETKKSQATLNFLISARATLSSQASISLFLGGTKS